MSDDVFSDINPDAVDRATLEAYKLTVRHVMDCFKHCSELADKAADDGRRNAVDALARVSASWDPVASHKIQLVASVIDEDPKTNHVSYVYEVLDPVLGSMKADMAGASSIDD